MSTNKLRSWSDLSSEDFEGEYNVKKSTKRVETELPSEAWKEAGDSGGRHLG